MNSNYKRDMNICYSCITQKSFVIIQNNYVHHRFIYGNVLWFLSVVYGSLWLRQRAPLIPVEAGGFLATINCIIATALDNGIIVLAQTINSVNGFSRARIIQFHHCTNGDLSTVQSWINRERVVHSSQDAFDIIAPRI